MLDRQTSGPLPRRMLRRFLRRPAIAWYGGAGLLVCALVGTLAWLARDGRLTAADTAQSGPIKPAADVETVGNAPLVASAAAPAPVQDPAPPAGATVVEVAPPPEPAALTPAPAAPTAPAASVQAPPQRQAAGRIAARAMTAKAASRTGRTAAPAHAASATTTASTASAASAAPRPRRPAASAKAPAAVPAVDTDVALITAIIQHASAREEAQEGCADKGCTPRKP